MNKITQIITAVIFITGSFTKGAGSSASDIGQGEKGQLAEALAYALPGRLDLATWCADTFNVELKTFQLRENKIDTYAIHVVIDQASNEQIRELKAECTGLLIKLIKEAHDKSVGSNNVFGILVSEPGNTYEDRTLTILKVCRAFLLSHNLPGSPLYDKLKLAVAEMMDAYTQKYKASEFLYNESLWPILNKWRKQKRGVSQTTLSNVSSAPQAIQGRIACVSSEALKHFPEAIQHKIIPYLHNTRLEVADHTLLEFAEYIINMRISCLFDNLDDNLEYEPLKEIVGKLWKNVLKHNESQSSQGSTIAVADPLPSTI